LTSLLRSVLAATLLATTATAAVAQTARGTASATEPAPLADLIRSVDVPYRSFVLANGLRVIVSTDRKAPVVAVSVWYDVGSKHEPVGRTGFAHLFEHLMFNGSENAPGEFFSRLKDIGATGANGTTYFDRTNYYETVPSEALARALFLESDRMGHLLGAVTQQSLDTQRGVVQNEKRQGDNEPYGLMQYRTDAALFPRDHPYGHAPIGSMADLDRASLGDVKAWFARHYGPNNAVLVLAGDIDVATARPLVERYFGDIPAGPRTPRPAIAIPALPRAIAETMTDSVSATRVARSWAMPGMGYRDAVLLELAAAILGGTETARLPLALVDRAPVASRVTAGTDIYAQGGRFEIELDVRHGVDPATATRALDAQLAAFLRDGPTGEDIRRYVTRSVVRTIQSVESASGKASVLANGALYTGDPGQFRRDLAIMAAATPETVRAAARRWLSRPAYTLTVQPGTRAAYAEAAITPRPATAATTPPAATTAPAAGTRGAMPPVGAAADVGFPVVERARLSNGIELVHARRPLPITYVTMDFDAGQVADPADGAGIHDLAMAVLGRTSGTLDAAAFGAARDRLGMRTGAAGSRDRTRAMMNVPSVNLTPALALFAAMVRRPAFAPEEIERARALQIAGLKTVLATPFGLSGRVGDPLVYGPASPYARAGNADPAVVAAATRDQLMAFHRAWVRPDKLRVFVVSDRSLADIRDALERAFGDWRADGPAGVKAMPPLAPASPRIVLIDRPGAPQSLVTGWIPTNAPDDTDLLAETTANEALAGNFLSRVNMNLREDKHWTYGASGRFRRVEHAIPYSVTASVQADRTGDSIAAIRSDIAAFLGDRPMTQAEFDRTINGATRELASRFEESSEVLSVMLSNDLYRRPDDYYATIAARYRAFTLPQLRAALPHMLDPAKTIWIVVGDAARVAPQLASIGLPVETIRAEDVR